MKKRIYSYIFLLLAVFPCTQCFNDTINKNINADVNKAKENNKFLPVPGNDGLIIIVSINHDSAMLSWTKGSDDTTPALQLMYKGVFSTINNISTVEEMDLNGTMVFDWTADIATCEVSGLTGNSTYYANVMVRDMDGNINSYVPVSFTTPADPPYTGHLPVPGNSGIIAITSISHDSAVLSWTKGSDDITPADQLQYKAVVSGSNNITTAEEMEQNGIPKSVWTADIGTIEVSGLTGNTVYYANMMVRDSDGNKKSYVPVSFTTPADPPYIGYMPVPGNNGLIAIAAITDNSAMLSWTKGGDDTTPAAQLRYKVVRSNYNDITTVDEMELSGNGTVVMGWTADVDTIGISGLAGNTVYYANVMVKDIDGNIKAYNPVTFITPGIIYMLSAGNYTGAMIPLTAASPRAFIDNIASTSKGNLYPSLTCSNIKAFIGLSVSDSIKNFPANYGLPVNWPIKGAGGFIIGFNWADLFDGSINTTLSNAKIIGKIAVVISSWWSGANADGSFAADSCSSLGVPWSSGSSTMNGQAGSLNSLDQTWLTNTADTCSSSADLYYLCW